MPNKTIYIRKEDEELWRKLPNKADAISKMLRGQQLTGVKVVEEVPYMKPGGTAPGYTVEDLIKSDANASTPTPKYDPVVAERQLSGEQTCCQNDTKPCKHWVWDVSTGEGYVNTLSGRSRDAE